MSNIIVKSKRYTDQYALESLFTYITRGTQLNEDNMDIMNYGGTYINDLNISTIINSFKLVKSLYGKSDGNQLHHIIFTIYRDDIFLDKETLRKHDMYNILPIILNYFHEKGIQCFYAVHEDSVIHHYHFILNSINVYGERMRNSKAFFNELLYRLKKNCKYWDWNDIIYDGKYSEEA